MTPDILLVVVVTSIIHSIFGVGVLLFGTPILLLLGYDFVDILSLVLPIALSISLMQIWKDHSQIDFQFFRKVLLLTLPPIAIGLFLVTHFQFNISFIIGGFLLLIAWKEMFSGVRSFVDGIMRYETLYFLLMGVVHGVSNLGGSLLTALVHQKEYSNDMARVTIAVSEATFVLVQFLTLWLFDSQQMAVSLSVTVQYLVIGVLAFALTDALLYQHLDRAKYRRWFSGFLAFSGLLLMVKGGV